MTGSPKKKRGPAKTALQRLNLLERTICGVFLQRIMPHKTRRCAACSSRVTNRHLGGCNGHSALTGNLYCLRCADVPIQQLLRLGGER
jgi:hypothetical protein